MSPATAAAAAGGASGKRCSPPRFLAAREEETYGPADPEGPARKGLPRPPAPDPVTALPRTGRSMLGHCVANIRSALGPRALAWRSPAAAAAAGARLRVGGAPREAPPPLQSTPTPPSGSAQSQARRERRCGAAAPPRQTAPGGGLVPLCVAVPGPVCACAYAHDAAEAPGRASGIKAEEARRLRRGMCRWREGGSEPDRE